MKTQRAKIFINNKSDNEEEVNEILRTTDCHSFTMTLNLIAKVKTI